MNPKQRAAESAVQFVQSDSIIGLGTGSTADAFLVALAAALKDGRLTNIQGIPTSLQTENRSRELGIPLTTLGKCPRPSVTIDGADEVGPGLQLIKGLGGALLREKILAQNTSRLIIIADASKSVSKLGTLSPLPVEVAQFEHGVQVEFFKSLGAIPTLRQRKDAAGPLVTDNGNYIYDLKFPRGIDDPQTLEQKLLGRAGVVETGLFLGLAKIALIADEKQVRQINA